MKYLRLIKDSSEIDTSLEYDVIYFNETEGDVVIKEVKSQLTTIVTYKNGTKWEGVIEDTVIEGVDDGSSGEMTNQIPNVSDAVNIILQDGITKITFSAFAKCSSLTSITIPNTVTEISDEAFRFSGLVSVTIPNSVTSIDGMRAFANCSSLTSVTLPNNITSIGYQAFNDCTSLASVTIPTSVTQIQFGAFSWCTSLTSVVYNGVTYTSKSALLGALDDNDVDTTEWAFSNTALTD